MNNRCMLYVSIITCIVIQIVCIPLIIYFSSLEIVTNNLNITMCNYTKDDCNPKFKEDCSCGNNIYTEYEDFNIEIVHCTYDEFCKYYMNKLQNMYPNFNTGLCVVIPFYIIFTIFFIGNIYNEYKKIKKLNKVTNVKNVEIHFETTSEYTDSTDFDEELIEEITYDKIKN